MWIVTHRDNIENITYDTLAGRIMHIDLATGRILVHPSERNAARYAFSAGSLAKPVNPVS